MFGAWQAGVWRALEPHLKPDVVIGASVGSLNAWLVASRCPAEEIAGRWRTLDTLAEVRWRFPQSFTDGVLDSSALETLIQEMCCSHQPSAELGIVATDFRRMRPTLFRYPDLAWQHVAVSCAVPGFLRHHRIDGTLYTDGGLVDPLPVWAALEMGATRIVGITCLLYRPDLILKVVTGLRRWGKYTSPDTSNVSFVEIGPGASLGTARDSMYWSPAKAQRWLHLGQTDGENALASVVECVSRGRHDGDPAENEQGCTHTVSTV